MDTDITDKYGASHAEGVLIEDLETRGELVEQKNSDFDGDNINLQDERAVVRKLDIVLLPMMAVALFVGYLDRGNIGNARVLGMQEDIGLSAQQFYNCVMMFFVGYMVIEFPAGMLLRYTHPRYVFSGALVSFGIFAACMAHAKSYAATMILRVFIGLGEAVANNAYIFISLWYKPNELSLRTGAIYSLTPIAGAVSGIISYGAGKNLSGVSGLFSWQWLFVIEGVVTIFCGLLLFVLCPGLPETVSVQGNWLFRTQSEHQAILRRYKASQNSMHAKFLTCQVKIALLDPKLYLGSLMVGAQGIGIGAFAVFLPTFIGAFGFSVLTTQLYSMIPYAFGLFSLIVFSYLTHRFDRKALVNLICLTISCTGFILLMATTNKVALVAGACFVAAGSYPALVISTAWVLTLHGGYTKRAISVWFIQIFVQSYSIIASQVYRNPPRFLLGNGIALGLYIIAAAATIVLLNICSRSNKAKEQRRLDHEAKGEHDPDMNKDYERLCDFHPNYIYPL